MKNSFVVLVSVVDIVDVDEVVVDIVDDEEVTDVVGNDVEVEVVVLWKSIIPVIQIQVSFSSKGSAKSIGPCSKSADNALLLLEPLKCPLWCDVTSVTFTALVKFAFGRIVVFDGISAEIEFLNSM